MLRRKESIRLACVNKRFSTELCGTIPGTSGNQSLKSSHICPWHLEILPNFTAGLSETRESVW